MVLYKEKNSWMNAKEEINTFLDFYININTSSPGGEGATAEQVAPESWFLSILLRV